METEPSLAICELSPEPPALEIRINFGMYAGRAATPAEIDELAKQLLPKVGDVSIVAEERHEIGESTEASLHQVRVEVDPERLPDDEHELDRLAGRLLEVVEHWARDCIADRKVELT